MYQGVKLITTNYGKLILAKYYMGCIRPNGLESQYSAAV